MQRIWSKQDDEPLYAINEAALYKRIQRKSRSTEFGLNMMEWGVILSSFFSIIVLYVNWVGDNVPWGYYLIPAMLFVISGYVFILRRYRQKNADRFSLGLMGELEKAIAHNNILLERASTMIWWYMLPVFGGFMLYFYVEQGPYWRESVAFMPIVSVLAFVVTRWELRKFHEPRQRDLEALRKLLTEDEVA
ncbi:MAG: hypothetical protein AAF614_40490 [Chloroflexota bacterium]